VFHVEQWYAVATMKKKKEYYTVTMTLDAAEWALLRTVADRFAARTKIPVKATTMAKAAYNYGIQKFKEPEFDE
jgi:hypothetical protein